MNILKYSILLTIFLECVIASGRSFERDGIMALKQQSEFESTKNWREWKRRMNLYDKVVTRSVRFIAGFINQFKWTKRPTLAALFIKRLDMVDEVLNKIKYDDEDLCYLTRDRPELAESHANFFKLMSKIQDPRYQNVAVSEGVNNLFKANKHDSVIPLIDALESSTLSRTVKDHAIQQAFYEGAWRGIKYFVERFHEHPAITSKDYANGLVNSWKWGKSTPDFRFLLNQADQGDLKKAMQRDKYKKDQDFRKAIDDAFPNAGPAGERHERPLKREIAKFAMKIFIGIEGLEPLGKENALGGIILDYLVGESDGTSGEKGAIEEIQEVD